jgi:hypothetical protein
MLVEPEGLEADSRNAKPESVVSDDPLLQLFYGDSLTADEFHEALRKQRGAPVPVNGESIAAHA